MKKHNHANLIKAKVDNMDLVIFVCNFGEWEVSGLSTICDQQGFTYFACIPKHEKACLNWLKGGDSQLKGGSNTEWATIDGVGHRNMSEWRLNHIFMETSIETRVKHKKMVRFIPIMHDEQCITCDFESAQLAKDWVKSHYGYINPKWQFVKVELEV